MQAKCSHRSVDIVSDYLIRHCFMLVQYEFSTLKVVVVSAIYHKKIISQNASHNSNISHIVLLHDKMLYTIKYIT